MARYIDADKLIAHLKDEIKECEIPFGSRANGKGVAYGTALGLKSAISFVETLSTADVVPKSEVESIITLNSQLEAEVFEQRKEIVRLHGILLQFTDIVHKWGAKNNIDTSEISLVPILQQEADSIIKKANQEYASEIFAEIESKKMFLKDCVGNMGVVVLFKDISELKKKYEVETK